jgi:F-type H+-transporting ATPase subunit delta
MHNIKVAKRYAKSLIDLARETGVLDAVHADMKLLVSVCQANKDLTNLLGNPIINADKKEAVLNAVFGGKIDKLTFSFFHILIRKGREGDLYEIAKEFIAQYKQLKGIATAVVITATGLNDHLRAEVNRIVKEKVKSEVELLEQVDKDLIGGFVLRIGDRQYDASVMTQLRRLAKEFSTNPYVRKN